MSRRWLLVLGASSGFGAASARAFAREGYDILGVHLDRRSTLDRVERLREDVEALGRRAVFFNQNAADDDARAEIISGIRAILDEDDGTVGVFLHSLAFGTLVPLVPGLERKPVRRRQLEMTMDVMSNSLVYWARDLIAADCMGDGGRIYAMTSSGSHQAWADYGPVSAAKAALEANVRQLARELGPRGITANSVLAGVTETPALNAIPEAQALIEKALSKNPHDRLTTPEDVAACLVELARAGTYWLNGNLLRIDGGEDSCA